MSLSYQNYNPPVYLGGKDCVPRAISVLTGNYGLAYAICLIEKKKYLKRVHSISKSGTYGTGSILCKQYGLQWHRLAERVRARNLELPVALAILSAKHHVMAVKHNVIYDSWDSSNLLVEGYWA